MITKFVPLPANSGGKRRSLALLTRLAAQGPTTLCAFDDGTADSEGIAELGVELRSVPWDPSPGRVLSGLRRTGSLSAARFWDARLQRQVLAASASAPLDLLQVEYAQLARYAQGVSARTRVLDLHNVESALVSSMAALRSGPARLALELEARRLRRIEQGALRAFDRVAVVTENDRARLAPAANVLLCPNGWDATELIPLGEEKVVAFVGLLGWGPNEDAAVWLAKEIWPDVQLRVPEATLLLVGRDPSERVLDLRSDTVEVTGSVPDVRPYLARARVATAPLRAAGGSRLKILEALDTGRPVVATSKGAEGLDDLVGAGIVIADSAADTVEELVTLLENDAQTQALGRAGHDAVRDRHSWDTTLRPLFDFLGERG